MNIEGIEALDTPKINIFVSSNNNYYRVFCLFYRKDGGFNVTIPKYKINEGAVGECVLRGNDMTLKEKGKQVSHMVKFAYPADGKVHFSEDGKIISEFKAKNTPSLNGSIDQLFGFYSQGYKNYSIETVKRENTNKETSLYMDFQEEMPESFRIIGRWYEKNKKKISPTKILNKFCFEEYNSTAKCNMNSVILIPQGKYHDTHVLVLSFIPMYSKLNGHKDDHIFLIGGFDSTRELENYDTNLLMFSYPVTSESLPNIDFQK